MRLSKNSRSYFVDHNNKITTWDDPRPATTTSLSHAGPGPSPSQTQTSNSLSAPQTFAGSSDLGPGPGPPLPQTFTPRSYAVRSVPLPPAAAAATGRVPQFTHSKGNALHQAIVSLPYWQQLQELLPCSHGPLDLTCLYMREAEGFTYGVYEERAVSMRLKELGFPDKFIAYTSMKKRFRYQIPDLLDQALAFVNSFTPRVAYPPLGLQETTFTIPGPVQCSYTVINQTMPPAMPIQRPMHRATPSEPAACPVALMEPFHDKGRMLILITIAFLRLRLRIQP